MKAKNNTNLEALRTGEVRVALFDNSEKSRYKLSITWDESLPKVQFIGLNPSTADESKDDPTVAKLKRLSRRLGFGTMHMTNLWSYRATDPRDMFEATRSECADSEWNDQVLYDTAHDSELVVACWGAHGRHLNRGHKVLEDLLHFKLNVHAFRLTKDGHPQHPLYLPDSLDPRPLRELAAEDRQ